MQSALIIATGSSGVIASVISSRSHQVMVLSSTAINISSLPKDLYNRQRPDYLRNLYGIIVKIKVFTVYEKLYNAAKVNKTDISKTEPIIFYSEKEKAKQPQLNKMIKDGIKKRNSFISIIFT